MELYYKREKKQYEIKSQKTKIIHENEVHKYVPKYSEFK